MYVDSDSRRKPCKHLNSDWVVAQIRGTNGETLEIRKCLDCGAAWDVTPSGKIVNLRENSLEVL